MYLHGGVLSLAIAALPLGALSQLITITEYPSTCSAVYTTRTATFTNGSAIYTSGSSSVTVYQSTVIVTPIPSSSAAAPPTYLSDAALNDGMPFVLQIQPGVGGSKRRQAESATYLTAGGFTTTDPSKAVAYRINDGTLGATTGGWVSTEAGVESMPFAISSTIGSINITFAFQNLHLSWNNTAFDGGAAGFYTVPVGNGSQEVIVRFSGPVDPSWAAVTFAAQSTSGLGIETISSVGATTISTMISMGSMTIPVPPATSSTPREIPSGTTANVAPSGTCGPSVGFNCYGAPAGTCCSQYGYCGKGPVYCGTGCQPGYGDCDVAASSSVSFKPTVFTSGTMAISTSVPVVPPSSAIASSMPAASSSGAIASSMPVAPSSNAIASSAVASSPMASSNAMSSAMQSSSMMSSAGASSSAVASSAVMSSSAMIPPYLSVSSAAPSLSPPSLSSIWSATPSVSLSIATSGGSSVTYSITFTPTPPFITSSSSAYLTLPTYSTPGEPIGPIGPILSTSLRDTVISLASTWSSSSMMAAESSSVPVVASSSSVGMYSSTSSAGQISSSSIGASSSYMAPSSNMLTLPSIIPEPAVTASSSTTVVLSISTASPRVSSTPSSTAASSSTRSSSSSAPTSTSSAAVCPAGDNSVVTDSQGFQYTIGCGKDTSGGSSPGMEARNSYADCMILCDNTSGCAGFTWAGVGSNTNGAGAGNCYLKSAIPGGPGVAFTTPNTPNSQLVAGLRVAGAATPTSRSSSSAPALASLPAQLPSSLQIASTTPSPISTTSYYSTTSYSSTISSTLSRTDLVLSSPTACDFGDPPNWDEDDSYCEVDLPQPMTVYTTSSTSTYFSTNGFVSLLLGSSQYQVQRYPTVWLPNSTIAPLWDDLYVYREGSDAPSPQQGMWYQLSDVGVMYEWLVGRAGDDNATYHFTMGYNYSRPGVFVFHYLVTGLTEEGADGTFASVGMQGLDSTGAAIGHQVEYQIGGITPGLVMTCDTNANTCTQAA